MRSYGTILSSKSGFESRFLTGEVKKMALMVL